VTPPTAVVTLDNLTRALGSTHEEADMRLIGR